MGFVDARAPLLPGTAATFAGLGFGGGSGLTIAFKIDFKSVGLGLASGFAGAFAGGLAAAFVSDLGGAPALLLSLDIGGLRSGFGFLVTAALAVFNGARSGTVKKLKGQGKRVLMSGALSFGP